VEERLFIDKQVHGDRVVVYLLWCWKFNFFCGGGGGGGAVMPCLLASSLCCYEGS